MLKTRICKICNEPFETSSHNRQICYKDHIQICPYCGVEVIWNHKDTFTGCKSCNQKNAVPKRKATMLKRYGGETTLESSSLKNKVKNTVQERYGCDNIMQNPDIKHKAELTNLAKYGSTNPMSNKEISQKSANTRHQNIDKIMEKIQQTLMKRYGVTNPSKIPGITDKITSTFLQKYGVKRAVLVPEFKQKMVDTMLNNYGVPYYIMSDTYRQDPHIRISKINEKFSNELTTYNISHTTEHQIGLKYYDFLINNTNTLIEVDPTYTHNVIGNHWNTTGIPINYHVDKTKVAIDAGYRCIHIWDWDNWNKIIQLIQPIEQKIYARNCKIYKLTRSATKSFLDKYNIYGNCRGQLLCLGLILNSEIIQVMTFGKPRYDKSYDVELLRLCSKPGIQVIGGASKLFKFAIDTFSISNIVAYCDLSKFTGNVYPNLNMIKVRQTPPREIWSKGKNFITANLLQSHGYNQLFKTNFSDDISNEELMLQNGWLPVYDCGQAVYEYK